MLPDKIQGILGVDILGEGLDVDGAKTDIATLLHGRDERHVQLLKLAADLEVQELCGDTHALLVPNLFHSLAEDQRVLLRVLLQCILPALILVLLRLECLQLLLDGRLKENWVLLQQVQGLLGLAAVHVRRPSLPRVRQGRGICRMPRCTPLAAGRTSATELISGAMQPGEGPRMAGEQRRQREERQGQKERPGGESRPRCCDGTAAAAAFTPAAGTGTAALGAGKWRHLP
mmetsp:Transcript_63017/g.184298  ORF Transcript_63017/g.184298 Transcript_63017/m.184298 type:complete len:231 (-) Transcript_63017:51-743(-)